MHLLFDSMHRGSNPNIIKSIGVFLLGSDPEKCCSLSASLHISVGPKLMCAKGEGSSCNPYFRLMVVLHLPRLGRHSCGQGVAVMLAGGGAGSLYGFNFYN